MRNLRDISWKSHKLPVTRAKNPVTLPWVGWLMYQGAGSKFYTGCTHWSHIHTNVTTITTRKYSGTMHTACFGSDFSSGVPAQWSSMCRGSCTEGVGGPVMSDTMSGWGRGCTGVSPMVRSKASWVIVTWDPLCEQNIQMRLKTLLSRNFVGGRQFEYNYAACVVDSVNNSFSQKHRSASTQTTNSWCGYRGKVVLLTI